MALAAATVTVTSTDITQQNEIVYGTIAIGASPLTYPTHGLAMSFAGSDVIKSSSVPTEVDVWSEPAPGVSPSGYQYQYVRGATRDAGLLAILTGAAAQSALAELSAGAVPAAVSGDVIRFKAVFPRV
jgi:hypothetical protein